MNPYTPPAAPGTEAPGIVPAFDPASAQRESSGQPATTRDGFPLLRAELAQAQEELAHARAELAGARDDLRHSRGREELARHASFHDGLTGLPNRTAFEERARLALALHSPESRPFGLLYIDLDGFKAINDAHGHAVGDELLRIVGMRLARTVRSEDVVCRYGGDEFLVLVVDVADEPQAAAIAGKLAALVSATCLIGAVELRVEPSIGIAIYPRDGATIASLLDRADGAMFRAKRRGSGHAFAQPVRAGEDASAALPAGGTADSRASALGGAQTATRSVR